MKPAWCMRGILIFIASACAVQAPAVEQVETFVPPKLTDVKEPRYPEEMQRKGQEGWVTVNYMVSPEGKPYDITIVASSGERDFEKAARGAMKRWRFDPAQLDGIPIDAGARHHITFALSGRSGASRGFTRNYKKLLQAVGEGERTTADERLQRLAEQDRNLYEEAFFHLARYNYFLQWGSEAAQYAAVSRATYTDQTREFLPDEILTGALTSKFGLELKLGKLGEARRTARQILARDLADEQRAGMENLLAKLEAVAVSDQQVVTAGRIDGGYRFGQRLLKSSFSFAELEGDIAEIRLHCERAYVGFVHEPGMTYTVQEGAGDCYLTAIGDPDTTFKLIER